VGAGASVEVLPSALRTGFGKVQEVGAQGLEGARKAVVAAQGMPRDWKRSLLITLGVMLATPLVWAGLPPSRLERIERTLQLSRPKEALALIDEGLAEGGGEVPRLLALKVAALHAAGRFPDERELLRAAPYQVTHGAHPLLLEALAEDFAVAEGDQELRELIGLVPPQRLQPQLEALAVGPRSLRQWGALRFLDLTGRHGAIDRVGLYASALRSPDCPVREAAAVRLGELHDGSAISALRELSETPKDETPEGRINCGQDEAAEAIRQLRKAAP
jgi:serine/threonine protein kinase, bacterial